MKKAILATLILAGVGGMGMVQNSNSSIPNDLTVVRLETDRTQKTITAYNKEGKEIGKMWLR